MFRKETRIFQCYVKNDGEVKPCFYFFRFRKFIQLLQQYWSTRVNCLLPIQTNDPFTLLANDSWGMWRLEQGIKNWPEMIHKMKNPEVTDLADC